MPTILTFDPGVNPSFPLPVPRDLPVDEHSAIKPYQQVIPRALRAVRTVIAEWRGLTLDQWHYFESFFHEVKYGAGVFYWRLMDPVFSPLHRGPDLSEVSGGALAQRTYSVRFTWFDSAAGEETKPSPAATFTVLANKLLVVTTPILPMGVPAIRVYASTTAGSEVLQATSTTKTWQEPTTGLVSGTAAPPAANTLKPLLKWRLMGGLVPEKGFANRYNVRTEFLEVHI